MLGKGKRFTFHSFPKPNNPTVLTKPVTSHPGTDTTSITHPLFKARLRGAEHKDQALLVLKLQHSTWNALFFLQQAEHAHFSEFLLFVIILQRSMNAKKE